MDGSPGCPSESELSLLRDALPGAAPDALARHVAGCERCQQRLLFGAERVRGRRTAARPPSTRRMLVIATALLLAGALLLLTLRQLLQP